MSESSIVDKLFAELKQRSLLQIAAIYAAGSWFLIQFADIAFPRIGLPDWSITATLVIAAIGLPVVLGVSWYMARANLSENDPNPVGRKTGARKFDLVVVAIVSLLLGYIYWDKFTETGSEEALDVAAETMVEGLQTDPAAKSIAVMPFENLSPEKDNAYFAAGVHEDVLTHLSKISDMKVISRTSVLKYQQKGAKSVREIGRELGVTHLLEGSVRRHDAQVRVTVQLIDASTDAHIWSENYDRELDNIFQVQTDVAKQVAAQLQIQLDPETISRVEAVATNNIEAYDLYIKGRDKMRVYSSSSVTEAHELFNQAITLDPNFSDAYAGLAATLVGQSYLGLTEWPEVRDQATQAAARALILNPQSGASHLAQSAIYEQGEQWDEAIDSLKRAFELEPNDADATFSLGRINLSTGRPKEARRWLEKTLLLDPLHETAPLSLAYAYARDDPELALEMVQNFLKSKPDHAAALQMAHGLAQGVADFDAMFNYLVHGISVDPRNLILRNVLTFHLINVGEYQLAQQQIDEVASFAPNHELVFNMKINLLTAQEVLGDQPNTGIRTLAADWLRVDPDNTNAVRANGRALMRAAMAERAEENFKLADELERQGLDHFERSIRNARRDDGTYIYSVENAWAVVGYATALTSTGQTAEGKKLFRDLLPELESTTLVVWANFHQFIALAELGETDAAFEALEKSFERGWLSSHILNIYLQQASFAHLRNDIRMLDLQSRLENRRQKAAEFARRYLAPKV